MWALPRRRALVGDLLEQRSDIELERAFDRQVDSLVRKGYPELSGLPADGFIQLLAPLRDRLPGLGTPAEKTRITFVIVIRSDLVASDKAMPLVELGGRQGFTRMEAGDLTRFTPAAGVVVPPDSAYLVADIDTGEATLNVTPDQAIKTIIQEDRSPLTIDEGVALITHYPDILRTRNCFSILGSRCGDRRVPAMWISGGSPRLGWCWAGNPHTWLGSASCGDRVGA